MDIDSLVARINELARKQKSTGLTEEELAERAKLREIYLNNIRSNFRQQLDTIEIVDDENDQGHQGKLKH
ncbi:DUF896 domain-containing protein [Paenibacillus sp. UMB7766-LJ446]|uniref:UPF0291 protein AMS66_11260 n=2 Tax=cellular organisms TaxID=131567 RepID=A0A0M9BPL7_9BACL|nr:MULTISPECIES: DUF896 domain-containing protein [Paenibacillus]KGP79179.1 hypothetical protein P363_0131830 [Paenibacillus sp. MAEPY1]KGP82386.1 hypothetical protein P364_0111745 [Paenibacillus sp. MAEPY2]KOY16433.1 hypothetical protein AMS66_11260 [Paenibacillus xylanivorans]MCZ1267359.1 DUF896 domain-containing protein [Paenibacillus tundrae]MDK8194046.1 DUF896 domain-containing protein [Paenibacillus sp. UMB7766-LJ446]